MSYEELLERSRRLSYALPTEANRLARFADRRHEIEAHAAGVRPILSGRVPELIDAFLTLKREAGSPMEQALYAGLDRPAFVSRLLRKRPLAFLGSTDDYLLCDGTRGRGGFEQVGTSREHAPLTLDAVLSYDEMALSALLGVSVPTPFINAGARANRAEPGAPGRFEASGVYVGLVGARFERSGLMESRHLLVTPAQNTAENGYGPAACGPAAPLLGAWARFYGQTYLPLYAEAAADSSGRYLERGNGTLFDTRLYARRLRASIEPFLLDADDRARAAGRQAYLHVVGLGLGVWRLDDCQAALMTDVYAEVLQETCLTHVSDLDFSWLRGTASCGGVASGGVFRGGGNAIRVHFSRRDPAAALLGEHAGQLLVAMYAWDSNAYPGNEYWLGSLSGSGDPAAACCSLIPELQNPDVNPRVSGEYARVFAARAEPTRLAGGRS